ncbi:M24 family metallopeptidase [Martelella sp. HB161492]|uniref:M24 family metallopeptidase n=1 Tax=Martelella sp. HB161492 TaxID=2720726 RepID=UPI00158FD898|nr:M24 family metallopeptidase [Martelella sp. HB161492]
MSLRLNAVSDAELDRRFHLLRGEMSALGLDAIIATGSNDWLGGHLRWLTDMPATNGYYRTAIFYADRPMSVVEMGSFGGRNEFAGRDSIHRGVGLQLTAPAFSAIAQTNRLDGELVATQLQDCRRIGLVTAGAMPAALLHAIEAIDGIEIIDATPLLDRLKAVKSAEEIENYRRTCRLQDETFAHVLGVIRPGMRDIDVASAAMAKAQALGSDQGIVLCGSAPQGKAARFNPRHLQGRVIEPGDHFSMLIEVNGPGGAYAEIARTIVLGHATDPLKRHFDTVLEAQQATLSAMKPGAAAAEIAAAHDRFMLARGLPPETRLYAHGQGGDMVERPLIRADETMVLAENMTLAVHPGYDDGTVFAVICDNYTIGPAGPLPCEHKTAKTIFEIH